MSKAQTRELSWYEKAADRMAKTGRTLFQACVDLNIMITSAEADAHFHSDSFQKVLRTTRARIYGEIANDPGHTKRTLLGKLLLSAERLMAQGKEDKAAEVLHKIAKIEGWEKSDNTLTVFADLTQRDLDEIKKKLSNEFGTTIQSPARA
jgi:hypothetical protein